MVIILTNTIFFSWYTKQLTKELKVFENRIDKKINKIE